MDIFEFRNRQESGVDAATEDLAQAVIGAAIEVHRILGPGLPETVYRRALSHELTLRGIPHEQEVAVPVVYKGVLVGNETSVGHFDQLQCVHSKKWNQTSRQHKITFASVFVSSRLRG